MRDFLGRDILRGSVVVYVTLTGHKPILTLATVTSVEAERIRVLPLVRSVTGWQAPMSLKTVWLHQTENIVVVERA
jgi:hypothetical protein